MNMMVKNRAADTPPICFIGSSGLFSFTAFKTLCAHNMNISQAILAGHAPAPSPENPLPVATPVEPQTAALHSLAKRHGIPVTFLGHTTDRQHQWQTLCANLDTPDFIFVACFPEKLPDVALNWPHQKSINLHPSLLPRYRGPDPVFWQLRHNESQTGITLHELSDTLDAGPILHQQKIVFPPGATRAELNTLLAEQGALAFIHLLTTHRFAGHAQDNSQASYFPLPTHSDYHIDPHWTVEHRNNFIRGNDFND